MNIVQNIWDTLDNKFTIGDDCWEWTASTASGYGRIFRNGKGQAAHRVTYELLRGAIPKGLEIDHLCRNTLCVRPDHMEAVTHTENVRRGKAHLQPKIHCPQGHSYNASNTYWYHGLYQCRECGRRRSREFARNKVRESVNV